MRNAFAEEATALAAADERLVLLSGDIGNRLFNPFKEEFPDRFFNCGVAEANMMGVAAGMALSGLRPVVYTISTFVTARCFEQIKLDVCYNRAPVIIVGVGAGLSYASLGPTHHSFEDIGLMRLLPDIAVICPCDAWEVRAAVRAALEFEKPVYLRLGKKGEPLIHTRVPDFRIGRAEFLREGGDCCLLGTGNILSHVLRAAELLEQQGVSAAVVNMHTVKPLDNDLLGDVFSRFKLVATVEEHSLAGGFGGSVAEWSADHGAPQGGLIRIGMADRFHHAAGGQEFARSQFGLAPEQIAQRVFESLN